METTSLLNGEPVEKRGELYGLLLSGLSALMFSSMSVFVKLAGSRLCTSEIILVRSFIQFMGGLLWCWFININPFGPENVNRLYLVARGLTGSLSLGCYFFTLTHMPLGDGTTIFFISPVFVAISARIFLNEKFGSRELVSTFLCLLGVVLVSRPNFIFGPRGKDDYNYKVPIYVTSLVAVLGAVFCSFAYCLVRIVGKQVHYMIHVTYFGFVSTLISMIYMLLEYNQLTSLYDWTFYDWCTTVTVGLMAFFAQSLLNASLQLAPAGPVALMRNLDIVFAFLFGMIFFNENRQWNSYLGATIIMLTTGAIGYLKWKQTP